jgi:hypothetical protein
MLEGADQRWTPPHATQGTARVMTELGEIARAEVRQFVMLPVAPDVLHRIEFRRVSRQLLDRQPAPLRGDELLDRVSAMRRNSSIKISDSAVLRGLSEGVFWMYSLDESPSQLRENTTFWSTFLKESTSLTLLSAGH